MNSTYLHIRHNYYNYRFLKRNEEGPIMLLEPNLSLMPTRQIHIPNNNYSVIREWKPLTLFTKALPIIISTVMPKVYPLATPFYGITPLQIVQLPAVKIYEPKENANSSLSNNNQKTDNSIEINNDYDLECLTNSSLGSGQIYDSNDVVYATEEDSTDEEESATRLNCDETSDDFEYYFSLPKDLFPPARMFLLDPNYFIDEFCKMSNILYHIPWLLDLEFGIPRKPTLRTIPIYSVKYNSIQCKNTPEAIHPGFEICDPDFRRALIFYYDYIVSSWYRSYVKIKCDESVDNFQSWLLLPMQTLGMCWP